MLSCTIDAKESCDVTTANMPGTFMQTNMDDTVHMMVLKDKMAKVIVKLIPNYTEIIS